MPREIRFRAWSNSQKKMFDRVLAGPGDPCSMVWEDDRKEWTHFDEFCGVIMQYTGRKDRKGVELYEGDVIKHLEGKIALAFWNETAFCWDLRALSSEGTPIAFKKLWTIEFEIIGNIYEHSELLKEKQHV